MLSICVQRDARTGLAYSPKTLWFTQWIDIGMCQNVVCKSEHFEPSTQHIAGSLGNWGVSHWKGTLGNEEGTSGGDRDTRGNRQRRSFKGDPLQVGFWHQGWNPCPIASKDPGSLPGTVSTPQGLPSLLLAKGISPSWVHMVTDITCYDFCKFFQIRQFLSSEVLVGVLLSFQSWADMESFWFFSYWQPAWCVGSRE